MEQLTQEQAIEFYEMEKWESMSFRERAEFQIQQKLLCMPFSEFHEAVEKTIGRPVYTHEFGVNVDGLKEEIFNGAEPPSFSKILRKLIASRA